DFIRKVEVTAAPPAPGAPAEAPLPLAVAPRANQPLTPANTGIRVIVIDPGHGGVDAGASTMTALEKDVTLLIARKVRSTLQSRFGATVLLTRDSDVALNSEARASVANNNQANLFISLHIGFAANKNEFASSVYVIQDGFAAELAPEQTQRLFQPWYL